MPGNFEVCLRLAIRAGEHDVHHARTGAAREESLDGGRHDFGFGLARLVGRDQRPEAVDDDVHRVAHFDEFFFALDGARHVELEIEGNQFERTLCQFAIIAHGHDEIHAVDADALPSAFAARAREIHWPGTSGQTWSFTQGLFLSPIQRASRGKTKRGSPVERDQDVNVAMHDLEAGDVEDAPSNPAY